MDRDDDERTLQARIRGLRHQHHRVLREYGELKARVTEYADRRWVTDGEAMEKRALQRAKLHKKDALTALQKQLDILERAAGDDFSPGPMQA